MSVAHRTYARALFEAAKEKGRLAEVREELGDFVAAVDQVPELDAMLRNPQLDPRAKAQALEDVLGGADQLVRNFLLLTVEKRRLRVEVTTAYELSDDEAKQIVGQIEQASGRPVDATRSVDPDLIGGIILQAGSLRLDASVRSRLERLRRELTTAR